MNWSSYWISKNKTLKWKNQSEWKKSEIKKNEAGWPIYLLKNIMYNSLHKNKFLILSYSFLLKKLWRTYIKTLLSVSFNICKEMGLMWICLWDLTVSLRKFTEAKWENVRNIHNTQGGFLITNIIVQIAYESSLIYVLGVPPTPLSLVVFKKIAWKCTPYSLGFFLFINLHTYLSTIPRLLNLCCI